MIAGNASALIVFSLTDTGRAAPASPGSILAVLAMMPKGEHLAVLSGVIVSALAAFLVSLPILWMGGEKKGLELGDESQVQKETAVSSGECRKAVKKVVFACDAGMGSSAMGAAVFRKKLAEAGVKGIEVVYEPVSSITADAQMVVTHHGLKAVSYTHLEVYKRQTMC